MKNNWFMLLALASVFVTACFDGNKTAGGSTEDAGIIADLNVAGVTQKGPFVKGATVTVQGIDCKTLKFTDEIFEGNVKSDKGDFTVEDVSLKSTCALFEVTGVFRNEISGKKSSEELTLHALTNLKDRKNVNINVLTELEYERLMFLVTEKGKKFAEAKAQAEKEVLAAFDIKGDFVEFENLNIFESGDENAALLAVSVMMQAETDDAGLVTRMEKFADSFAETGKWKDSGTKKIISEWAIEVTANGGLDSIRKNVEAWDLGDTVPAFEKFIEAYADGDSVVLIVTPKSSSSETSVSSSSRDTTYNAEKNTLTDTRDGQVYRTVTIGNQIWMAENLNYKTDSSFCYNDSAEYCAKYGRLYIWDAAMDACPDGWHLPDSTEWNTLFSAVGGKSTAEEVLKSTSGWVGEKGEARNGTDNYGFAALPAGVRDERGGLFSREGGTAKFWSSTERSSDMATNIILYYYFDVFEASGRHDAMSVRCLNDDTAVPPSSSSSKPVEKSSSSAKADGSEYDATANTLKDLRDGKVYRTMQLGVQTWMAENLNFETKGSLCYHDSAEYCAKYGRLYPWSVAMDSMGIWGANGKGCGFGSTCPSKYPVRGVCPSGWHVPTQMDWTVLFEEVGGSSIAGKVLKSISGWSGRGDNTGTDDFGFSALPAGHYTSVEGLDGKAGTVAFFASSTERDKNSSYYVYLDYKDEARFSNCDETAGLSVRCVMDDDGSISPSSSSGNSSSSELKREQCDVDTDGNCFKDERDGQTYRTVIIGTQTWMAENLNYAYTGVPYKYENDASDSISWCYGNDPAYCAKYGRLYTWAAAMDSVGAWTENSKGCGYGKACSPTYPVQGVCPSGWHLPTEEEFRTLFTTVGGDSIAGAMLKTTSGWNRSGNGATGMDGYSFAALPSGYRENDGVYYAKGGYAYFWTSSVMIDNYVHSVILIYNNDNAILNGHPMFSIHSVRCIKD